MIFITYLTLIIFSNNRFLKYLGKLVFKDTLIEENNIVDLRNSLESILYNNKFKSMISMARNNWLEISIDEAITSILEFVSSLELVEV